MSKQRVAAVECVCNGVFLVFTKLNIGIHTGESQLRAVKFSRTNAVKQLVVSINKHISAVCVLENPILKLILYKLRLSADGSCCVEIKHTLLLAVLIDRLIDLWITQIEDTLHNLVGVHLVSTVFFR